MNNLLSTKKQILVLSDSLNPWHSFWIRFGQYVPYLQAKIDICSQVVCEKHGLKGWKDHQTTQKADVIIIYRFTAEHPSFIRSLQKEKEQGVNIISDIDDYLWDSSDWDRMQLKQINQILRISNTITCSTKELLGILTIMFPKQEILLIPNSSPRAPNHKTKGNRNLHKDIRIGWTGAPWTRKEDLEILKPLAKWTLGIDSIKWVHLGRSENHLSFAQAVGLSEEKVISYPLTSYSEYLQQFDFDIGLAPASNKLFNRFKSELKILEYSAFGIPWLASDMNAYQDLCKEWNLEQRICSNTTDWIKNLLPLLDFNYRTHEGKRLQLLANNLRPIDRSIKTWQTLINRKAS